MLNIFEKIFGSANDRYLKKLHPHVEKINGLESEMEALSDDELAAQTDKLKEQLDKGATLDDILHEAFATVREVSKRTLGMRHYDVQLMGAICLHEGNIGEMKTGEGKTLVATMPLYLNALEGEGAHLITVNDYLAERDAKWMGHIYNFLGMEVGVILGDMPTHQREEAYGADITYGTNNEFGFDYLRDNMKTNLEEMVQRKLHYAIIDEVDSVLIDESRTPLIISGKTEQSTELYHDINNIIPYLKKDHDYLADEEDKNVTLTDQGVVKIEEHLELDNLYDPDNIEIVHHVSKALEAHTLYRKDDEYIVRDNEVVIVDEFTGRPMPGRRWSDGLHQAIEAKEGVNIKDENQTLASVTFQNFFRMYDKLAGMTGTADTEAAEFNNIYGLDVNVIPTNQPMIRIDNPDVIYKTEREKFIAVVEEIKELYEKGQPVLVGTISIEKSEMLSKMLKRAAVPHSVLNAKHHEKEAEIIAQAGQPKTVTISTNMAGRGTDIVLGEGVTGLGGLHILGTERHESRRIDNQLRGRAGRQGDPGSSRFYLSLEDDLLRIFGSDRIASIMERFGMEEGEPIEAGMISKAIENAQRKVEAHNFDIRKHLLEYDDVMNKQREIIYSLRRDVLMGEGLEEIIRDMMEAKIEDLLMRFTDPKTHPEDWDVQGLKESASRLFGFVPKIGPEDLGEAFNDLKHEDLEEMLRKGADEAQERRKQEFGEDLATLQRIVLLQIIDEQWVAHLQDMDHMKEGIGLRGYGQMDPLREYKKEGFALFEELMGRIREETLSTLSRFQVLRRKPPETPRRRERPMQLSHGDGDGPPAQVKREGEKIGRNAPCPCGSGKKYKKCCGANA